VSRFTCDVELNGYVRDRLPAARDHAPTCGSHRAFAQFNASMVPNG
jgi:hypothetical protein